jgi:hypothetical protein
LAGALPKSLIDVIEVDGAVGVRPRGWASSTAKDSRGQVIGTVSQFAPNYEHVTHTRFAVVVPRPIAGK